MSPLAPGGRRAPTARAAVVVVSALARRPWLWPAAIAEGARLARPGWWRRRPLLPLPDEALWRFRMQTAYGGAGDAVPAGEDVASFIDWCAAMRKWRRR